MDSTPYLVLAVFFPLYSYLLSIFLAIFRIILREKPLFSKVYL
jgi:hypothetical protein